MAAVFRIVNPAPSRGRAKASNPSLFIINGGRKKMAATKRKYSRPRAKARPRLRAKARPRTNAHRPRQYARARVHHRRRARASAPRTNRRRVSYARRGNPRRTYKRRGNPFLGSVTGIFEGALTAIIGMGITDYATGLVTGFFPMGGNPLVGIGVKLGVAWGVGELARKFGFAKHAQLLAIGGAVSAGKDALSLAFGGGGILFPSAPVAVQTAPGQAMIPASMTGDNIGVSEIAFAPAGMSEIAFAPAYPGAW